MNHLAHLFLAGPSAESLIGNLSGDFVKGPIDERIAPELRAGIRQHRQIDAFTDSHPAVAAFRRVLVPEHGHYARIIADVFFDHFLANDFVRYAGETLDDFLARTFATIDTRLELLPERLRVVYPRMRNDGWLQSYQQIGGIHMALTQLSSRLSRRPHLETSTRHLTDSREELEGHFQAFLPDVIAYANAIRSEP